MTELKELTKNTYDFAIIGSNLQAYILAYQLSCHFHKKVALVEANDQLGREDGVEAVGDNVLFSHFSRIPDQPLNRDLLQWLSEISGESTFNETAELTPLEINSGKLSPFVGFGDKKFLSLDILRNFTSSKNVQLDHPTSFWIEKFQSLFIGDTYTLAEVTKIETNENGFQYAVINGSKNLQADTFIYCLPPKSVKNLLNKEVLANKNLQKLLKMKSFSQANLLLKHPNDVQIEEHPLHILFGNKDDFEPVIGEFHRDGNGDLFSLWSSWTPTDFADDPEHLGGLVKHQKKQIKRAYPELFENVLAEKIVVSMDSEGQTPQNDWLSKPFANVPGLWLCHPQLTENTGFIAKVEVAKVVLDALRNTLGLEHVEYTIAASDMTELHGHETAGLNPPNI